MRVIQIYFFITISSKIIFIKQKLNNRQQTFYTVNLYNPLTVTSVKSSQI